jgi:octopine/nopaline transport system permease protein
MIDIPFLVQCFERLLPGIPLTLQLAVSSLALGFVLAVLLALARDSGIKPLDWFARLYVFVFRGTPLLVVIFLVYYGLAQFPEVRQSVLWPWLRQAYWCALLALTLNTAAYGSEILRGGLRAVPVGAIEAGRAAGMSPILLFRRIVAPIALRQALPGYSNEMILMVKATALGSTVTLMEMTGLAHKLISESYRAIEVFLVAGSVYLVINFTIERGLQLLEWRLSPHLRDAPRPSVLLTEVAVR